MASSKFSLTPLNIFVKPKSGAAAFYLKKRRSIPMGRRGTASTKRFHESLPKRQTAVAGSEAIFPAMPGRDLIYHGGKLISNLTFQNLYLGGKSRWSKSDITSIDGALAAAMSDQNLNNVMVQYFREGEISSTTKDSRILSSVVPERVGPDFLKQTLRSLFDRGMLDEFPLESTLFNLLTPSGVVLLSDDDGSMEKPEKKRPTKGPAPEEDASSLSGLGGFHGSVHIATGNGTQVTVYYSTSVYSERLDSGQENGIVVFEESWKNVVCTLYHELNEARTDADVDDVIATENLSLWGWADRRGSECGDFPIEESGSNLMRVMQEVPLSSGSGSVPVQFQYSNFVHGPEGPASKARPFAG
jgi:hypothetical protein